METNLFLRGLLKLSGSIKQVSKNLDFENPLPERNIDEILENAEDKRKLDAAVEHLKLHKEEKYKEVTLSENEKLIISLS